MSYVGRVNAYDCPRCHQTTWTRDVDDGTTPAFMTCRASQVCEGMSASRWYMVPHDHPEPTIEWYRPTEKEAKRMDRKHPGSLEHWRLGGLFPRPIREDADHAP